MSRARHRSPWWLWALMLVLLGTVVVMQRPDKPDNGRIQKQAKGLGEIDA